MRKGWRGDLRMSSWLWIGGEVYLSLSRELFGGATQRPSFALTANGEAQKTAPRQQQNNSQPASNLWNLTRNLFGFNSCVNFQITLTCSDNAHSCGCTVQSNKNADARPLHRRFPRCPTPSKHGHANDSSSKHFSRGIFITVHAS